MWNLLKEVLYRYVPKVMMDRPKKGFSVPLCGWLSEVDIYDWAWNILEDSHLVRDGIVEKNMVDRLKVLLFQK